MCLIIAHKKGAPALTKDQLSEAWATNSDGAGIAFVKAGRIVVVKPFFKMKSLLKAYRTIHGKYGAESPILVHLRIATHGSRNAENTHPHLTSGGQAALAHNGIIDIDAPKWLDISDTVAFCRMVTDHIEAKSLTDGSLQKEIEDLVRGSKLAIIDTEGNLRIYHESMGHWSEDKQTWFSNYSYRKWQRYPANGKADDWWDDDCNGYGGIGTGCAIGAKFDGALPMRSFGTPCPAEHGTADDETVWEKLGLRFDSLSSDERAIAMLTHLHGPAPDVGKEGGFGKCWHCGGQAFQSRSRRIHSVCSPCLDLQVCEACLRLYHSAAIEWRDKQGVAGNLCIDCIKLVAGKEKARVTKHVSQPASTVERLPVKSSEPVLFWYICRACASKYAPSVSIKNEKRADVCLGCSRMAEEAGVDEKDRPRLPPDVASLADFRLCSECNVMYWPSPAESNEPFLCDRCFGEAVADEELEATLLGEQEEAEDDGDNEAEPPATPTEALSPLVKCDECHVLFEPKKNGVAWSDYRACGVCWSGHNGSGRNAKSTVTGKVIGFKPTPALDERKET